MYSSMLELGMLPSDIDEQEFSVLTEIFAHNAKKDKKSKQEPEMTGDEFFSAHSPNKKVGKKVETRTQIKRVQ